MGKTVDVFSGIFWLLGSSAVFVEDAVSSFPRVESIENVLIRFLASSSLVLRVSRVTLISSLSTAGPFMSHLPFSNLLRTSCV